MKNFLHKKLVLMVLMLIAIAPFSNAQIASTFLDNNDVMAIYHANGSMFWDMQGTRNAFYIVPKSSATGNVTSTIFTNAFMIGGVDAGGNLHTAGMTYRQRGDDFWPGPLNVTTGEAHEPANWNRIWRVSSSTISYHKSNYQTPNYVVPQEILDWPGNGPVGCSPILAPFFDRDGDGLYEPVAGDYPLIKGDQAVYFIFNDNAQPHTHYPGGLPLKIEVHGMAWAISSTNKFLDQATFLTYNIFNRSNANYFDVKAGFFTDFDLGNPNDDYVATDTLRNMVYCYNADSVDENGGVGGYGKNPPAQGVVFLNDKMKSTICFTNSGTSGIDADPRDAVELYRYLNGYWADNLPLTYGTPTGRGGSTPTKFIFTGDLCPDTITSNQWRETQPPGDRRTIASFSIDTLQAGSSMSFNMAFVYARGDSGIISSQCKLELAADFIKSEFGKGNLTGIDNQVNAKDVNVFPNPVTFESIIKISGLPSSNYDLEITDLQGRLLLIEKNLNSDYKINASDFASGMYLLKLKSVNEEFTGKFIVK